MLSYKTKYTVRYPLLTGLATVIFVVFHVNRIWETSIYGYTPVDYLKTCSLLEFPEMRAPLEKWTLCLSYTATGNENFLPLAFSAALIPLTFLLAKKITKDDKKSFIASSLLLLSPIIGYLGTTSSLTADWAFYLVLSLYMGYKRPELSGVFFFMSVASKGLPMLIIPFILYFVLKSDMKRKKVALLSFSVAAIIIFGIWISGDHYIIQQDGLRWNIDNTENAVHDMWFVFRSDPLQYAIIPLAMAVTFFSKNSLGKPMFLMMGAFYSLVFLLPIFSMYVMFDYRMIPLIVFAAIGVNMRQ